MYKCLTMTLTCLPKLPKMACPPYAHPMSVNIQALQTRVAVWPEGPLRSSHINSVGICLDNWRLSVPINVNRNGLVYIIWLPAVSHSRGQEEEACASNIRPSNKAQVQNSSYQFIKNWPRLTIPLPLTTACLSSNICLSSLLTHFLLLSA